MLHRIRACIVVLAALAVLPAARAAQTCTQKFADLKTCTIFNGLFATGGAANLNATKFIDGQLMGSYDNSKEVIKNDECKALYTTVSCIQAVGQPDPRSLTADIPVAAPCSSNGALLKMCKGLCVQYGQTCSTAAVKKTFAEVERVCSENSAPTGAECFGDAGVLGMKSAAHTSIPPVFAVALLALAACLGL
jgi:hypothetical protein